MRIFFKLLYESFLFSWDSIVSNKMRMFLSLLGISIGIFSVISVLTVFDSMRLKIEDNLSKLGSNVVFVGKFPWIQEGGKNKWWKYAQRPNLTYKDMKELERRGSLFQATAIFATKSGSIKYNERSIGGVRINGISYHYAEIKSIDIERGRYFTENEADAGSNVAIVGKKIAQKLLDKDAVGKTIIYRGKRVRVIGSLHSSGDGNLGPSDDYTIFIPIQFMKQFTNMDRIVSAQIAIKPKPNIDIEEVKGEVRMLMRAIHRLKPKAEDDFAVNETSMISEQFEKFFRILHIAGWVIGGFSLLVGGFGIANIMFVSVKERTKEIGIQMAIGAKRFFILFQFLFESVFLALFGGIIGLLLIFVLLLIANTLSPFPLVLTIQNTAVGLWVSIGIGLFSGLAPAYLASKMDPVEAMRN